MAEPRPERREGPACPRCGRALPPPARDGDTPSSRWPHFPFCSDRCRLLDLHAWLTGGYVIPGPPADAEEEPRA